MSSLPLLRESKRYLQPESRYNNLCVSVRQVRCRVSVWTLCVPPHAAATRRHERESAVLLATVKICNIWSLAASLLPIFLCCIIFKFWRVTGGFPLSPQTVNMTRKCLLMGKFSSLLEADPACSAGARQVWAGPQNTQRLLPLRAVCLHW